MRVCRALAAAAVLFAAPQMALACRGDKVQFAEDFSIHDATWGDKSASFEIKEGKAHLRPEADRLIWRWMSGFQFHDLDLCATVGLVETSDPTNSYVGILFWTKDVDNAYFLNIASNGFFQVRRRLEGKWTAPVIAWTKTDAIKQGPNQPNNLRLVLKGQSVTIEINDKEVARFRAQAPDQPSMIGVTAASAAGKSDHWWISDLKVTNVK